MGLQNEIHKQIVQSENDLSHGNKILCLLCGPAVEESGFACAATTIDCLSYR